MLVALDLSPLVVKEAVELGAQLIITHHPLLFRPLRNLRYDQPLGQLVQTLIQHGVMVYTSHTNLDVVDGGVNTVLAELLGLTEAEPLQVSGSEELCKIVVFVPRGHEDVVREAMGRAGAGWIGNYSDCTFQTLGEGTFRPLAGANPFIGRVGHLEKVEEFRLETIVPAKRCHRVISAMLKAHPYEEVAYDVYPLLNQGRRFGLGRIGKLMEPLSVEGLINLVKQRLEIEQVVVIGPTERNISRVAVCGGSGGSLIQSAVGKGADVLITGDIKYHEAREAVSLGLTVIDAGHARTESVIIPALVRYLREHPTVIKADVQVFPSTVWESIWQIR